MANTSKICYLCNVETEDNSIVKEMMMTVWGDSFAGDRCEKCSIAFAQDYINDVYYDVKKDGDQDQDNYDYNVWFIKENIKFLQKILNNHEIISSIVIPTEELDMYFDDLSYILK